MQQIHRSFQLYCYKCPLLKDQSQSVYNDPMSLEQHYQVLSLGRQSYFYEVPQKPKLISKYIFLPHLTEGNAYD